MKKQGFTLTELLSVVVILGVIVLIAVPAFNKYILKTENKYYNILEKNVKNAGREYLNENPSNLPKESGYYSKIEKEKLLDSGIIEDVVDSEGRECERIEIIVRKLENGEYEYESCLKCGEYETDTPVCKGNYDHNEGDDPNNDNTAPTVCNLYITKKTTNSVTLEVVGIDEQSGISGYSFSKDGGNTYINSSTPIYTFTGLKDNQKYSFKVKCKNNGEPEKEKESEDKKMITASFTNPTMKQIQTSDGFPIASFEYSPKRDIEITYNDYNIDNPKYFLRSNVSVKVNYPVYECVGDLNTLEQNNCQTTSVTTIEENKWYQTNNLKTVTQFATDTELNDFMLYAAIGDTVNVSGISSYMVTKIDVTPPTINAINNPKTLANVDYDFLDNVTYTFGFSDGKTKCNPANSLKTGVYNVTCTATGNNGLTKDVTFEVKHSYPATYSTCAYKETVHYDEPCNCGPGYCGVCHGCCDYSCGWVNENNEWCDNCCCDRCSGTRQECRSGYICPNGGKLSGKTCYY